MLFYKIYSLSKILHPLDGQFNSFHIYLTLTLFHYLTPSTSKIAQMCKGLNISKISIDEEKRMT